ncbi:MAG: hydroxymethylbilane synthase [Flavobacteriaceae bacterium]|nr:hydroxymethylbilane synthase [Flavobacteriaceae bacterium]
MNKTIRIGTRDSELALWQAKTVQGHLEALGYTTTLVPVKSTGDLILDKPLYELGITGIFTKTLDVAMLGGQIDIAVHSMKDVPTALPKGIVQAAVLPRANTQDLLVHKGLDFLESTGTIATGSLRRKAQWLHRYPNHEIVDLRGNVNTRMQKLQDNTWNGAIFAAAGLERIHLKPDNYIDLDWMIPAPAQGAMLVVAMENDPYCLEAVANLNHTPTAICTQVEREFLRDLEGGCTAPIGAIATIEEDTLHFEGALFALDGTQKIGVQKNLDLQYAKGLGKRCAKEVLAQGGEKLMNDIKAAL